jgi:hypothetical protein
MTVSPWIGMQKLHHGKVKVRHGRQLIVAHRVEGLQLREERPGTAVSLLLLR